MPDNHWFEFRDLASKDFSRSVWIPVKASTTITKHLNYGDLGYTEEIFLSESIAVPSNEAARLIEDWDWGAFVVHWSNKPFVANGRYFQCGDVTRNEREVDGIRLVYEQHLNPAHQTLWHLAQDFVLAYDLVREGNEWLATNEGYLVVAKETNVDGNREISIRAEFLKDYLCARSMSLLLATFRSRDHVQAEPPAFDWPDGSLEREDGLNRVSCRFWDIIEGDGAPFDSTVATFKLWRTDIDPNDDVPLLGPENDENVGSESGSFTRTGTKATRIEGQFWHKEIIQPAEFSFRLRHDEKRISIEYVVEPDGAKALGGDLKSEDVGRWLWFSPDVINAILRVRNSSLEWYTRHTGAVFASPGERVWFGINELGLITVYASDVCSKPEWQQRIWAGHNIAPEGKVCAELLAAQVRTDPASTKAPEAFLEKAMLAFELAFQERFGFLPLRTHPELDEISRKCHRFRAIDQAGLYSLAKDLNRILVERLDIESLKQFGEKGKALGGIKLLERALATIVDPNEARDLTSVLVGIYDLRKADAHLPSSDTDNAITLTRISVSQPLIFQGGQLLHNCVSCLYGIADVLGAD